MISATQAIAQLQAGNQRFIAGQTIHKDRSGKSTREALVAGQTPWAIILGCSDSRVPAETIFDAGFGDLFVIRVAGNIAAQSQLGSIEYAVKSWGTPLVVVLGHTACGAIQAAVSSLQTPSTKLDHYVQTIVTRIQPSLSKLREKQADGEIDIDDAVATNVHEQVKIISSVSQYLKTQVKNNQLQVVPAVYSLRTGDVDFL